MNGRIVFDTNIVVSSLLFSHQSMRWLRETWRSEKVTPLASTETVRELLRVLAYPKFQLSASERDDLLGEFLPFIEIVELDQVQGHLPRCRDPHDQIFLELACAAGAALVTGDADLLTLAAKSPVAIMSLAAFKRLRVA